MGTTPLTDQESVIPFDFKMSLPLLMTKTEGYPHSAQWHGHPPDHIEDISNLLKQANAMIRSPKLEPSKTKPVLWLPCQRWHGHHLFIHALHRARVTARTIRQMINRKTGLIGKQIFTI